MQQLAVWCVLVVVAVWSPLSNGEPLPDPVANPDPLADPDAFWGKWKDKDDWKWKDKKEGSKDKDKVILIPPWWVKKYHRGRKGDGKDDLKKIWWWKL